MTSNALFGGRTGKYREIEFWMFPLENEDDIVNLQSTARHAGLLALGQRLYDEYNLEGTMRDTIDYNLDSWVQSFLVRLVYSTEASTTNQSSLRAAISSQLTAQKVQGNNTISIISNLDIYSFCSGIIGAHNANRMIPIAQNVQSSVSLLLEILNLFYRPSFILEQTKLVSTAVHLTGDTVGISTTLTNNYEPHYDSTAPRNVLIELENFTVHYTQDHIRHSFTLPVQLLKVTKPHAIKAAACVGSLAVSTSNNSLTNVLAEEINIPADNITRDAALKTAKDTVRKLCDLVVQSPSVRRASFYDSRIGELNGMLEEHRARPNVLHKLPDKEDRVVDFQASIQEYKDNIDAILTRSTAVCDGKLRRIKYDQYIKDLLECKKHL